MLHNMELLMLIYDEQKTIRSVFDSVQLFMTNELSYLGQMNLAALRNRTVWLIMVNWT